MLQRPTHARHAAAPCSDNSRAQPIGTPRNRSATDPSSRHVASHPTDSAPSWDSKTGASTRAQFTESKEVDQDTDSKDVDQERAKQLWLALSAMSDFQRPVHVAAGRYNITAPADQKWLVAAMQPADDRTMVSAIGAVMNGHPVWQVAVAYGIGSRENLDELRCVERLHVPPLETGLEDLPPPKPEHIVIGERDSPISIDDVISAMLTYDMTPEQAEKMYDVTDPRDQVLLRTYGSQDQPKVLRGLSSQIHIE